MPSSIGYEIAGLGEWCRQPEHVGEAAHEAAQLLGSLDDDADRLFEVMTVRRLEVA